MVTDLLAVFIYELTFFFIDCTLYIPNKSVQGVHTGIVENNKNGLVKKLQMGHLTFDKSCMHLELVAQTIAAEKVNLAQAKAHVATE